MIRKERVVSKKGVDVMHEIFYHDPLRVLVDGMAPVALMESLQPKLAPKDLKKEAEDSIRILSEKVEAFTQGEVGTDGSQEWTPKHCQDTSVEIVKAERLVAEATRNGSFSRKPFDDIMEDSLGTVLHNEVRQAWNVLEMRVKGSWDHTQMLRTEGQAKSSITPFFLKILNGAFKVNSIINTMVWAAGGGKDGLDDQEEIIFEVNSLLGKLEEVQTINRPVLLKAHNGKLYWVTALTGIQLKVIMDLGLDGAALMDTVDTDDAPCSISSEYRCDRCWIAKLMDKRSSGKGYHTIGYFLHLIPIKSGMTKREIAKAYHVSTKHLTWINLPPNHELFKSFTVKELYDSEPTLSEPTVDFSKYKDDEPIKFRGTRQIRVRLLFDQDRTQDSRLSNLRPERKKNCISHCHFRCCEQMLCGLQKSAAQTLTLDEINKVYASQKIAHRAKADIKKPSSIVRPKLGEGWKCDELFGVSKTEPTKKIYEVLVEQLDSGRQSTLDVWSSYEKMMALLKWQYAPKEYLEEQIGPLTFEAHARFCIRYPAEDVQYYHHQTFAHLIHCVDSCSPGLERSESEEGKHSWSKKKAQVGTTRGGGGKTMLSQLSKIWFTELYRWCAVSEGGAMRRELEDEMALRVPHSPEWQSARTELQEFGEIETLPWVDFLIIQRNHLDRKNRKRSSDHCE